MQKKGQTEPFVKPGDQGTVSLWAVRTGGSRPLAIENFAVCCKYLEENEKRTF